MYAIINTSYFVGLIVMYVGIMNCIFAAHIEYRNISIPENCQPVQNPLILYYPDAYPPPILSHPMHALPLFCPTPCIPSTYSIPPHACPPPILSHPMHAFPLFYPTHACPPPILSHPCMPSPCSIPPHAYPPPYSIPAYAYPAPYSIPAHAYLPPTLSQPMHTLPYSIPAHTHPPPILSQPIHTSPILFHSLHVPP